jgi:hypothetical protein
VPSRHKLGLIRDDCEALAGRSNNLLPQQRSAPPLDQVERAAFHLVCAVDRKIDALMFAEGGERDASCRCLRCRTLRSRDAEETQALPVTLGERLDGDRR